MDSIYRREFMASKNLDVVILVIMDSIYRDDGAYEIGDYVVILVIMDSIYRGGCEDLGAN